MSARQAIYTVPGDKLLDLLTGRLKLANVPADAVLLSWWIDVERDEFNAQTAQSLRLRMEHASFVEVPDGGRVPEMRVRIDVVKQPPESERRRPPQLTQAVRRNGTGRH